MYKKFMISHLIHKMNQILSTKLCMLGNKEFQVNFEPTLAKILGETRFPKSMGDGWNVLSFYWRWMWIEYGMLHVQLFFQMN